MKGLSQSRIEYVAYIATSPEKIWDALINNEVRKQWWRGHYIESEWKVGSSMTSFFPDGSVEAKGKVVTSEPPLKLSYELETKWSKEFGTDSSRITFEVIPYKTLVKLTLTYEANERLINLTRPGWPAIISSLKTLLELGKPLHLTEVFGAERNPAKT